MPDTRPGLSARLIPWLLWIDSGAGLAMGVVVLSLAPWLSRLYALPLGFVLGMGVANLAYGTFSLSLARRAVRPPTLLVVLVTGNATWAVLCVGAAIALARQAGPIGLAHLWLEAGFVGGLAALEWHHRAALRDRWRRPHTDVY